MPPDIGQTVTAIMPEEKKEEQEDAALLVRRRPTKDGGGGDDRKTADPVATPADQDKAAEKRKEKKMTNNSDDGATQSLLPPTADMAKTRAAASSSRGRARAAASSGIVRLVGSTFRTLVVDIPLLLLFLALLITLLVRRSYDGHVRLIVDSLRHGEQVNGFYPLFHDDFTYYNRRCTAEDITTNDANDLLVKEGYSSDDAAHVMMKHGAVVFKDVLRNDTAIELRKYLESRHDIQDELPWHEKFFEEIDRLALGLGVDDHPIIAEALAQVGTNPTIRTALEGIVGVDPAVVEISTLTSMHGAEDQGIHTDTDWFGSSVLYSRNFLHSYTMFIALQDTTARMGATTLCPGSHHCADEDLEDVCLDNGAFEASSNGLTGKSQPNFKGGALLRGDAMMFNQNVWHRGAANNDPANPYNRVMFIVTFITRPRSVPGDYRYQGLGTYYYQRWNQWGHTYNDLADAKHNLAQPFGALRGLGLYKPRKARWGITWVEQFAREFANKEHFYANGELPDFTYYLDKIGVPKYLQGTCNDRRGRCKWDTFLEEMMGNMEGLLKKVNVMAVGGYLAVRLVLWLLLWLMFGRRRSLQSQSQSSSASASASASAEKEKTKVPRERKNLLRWIPPVVRRLLLTHGIACLVAVLAARYIDQTELAKWAYSGAVRTRPFPRPNEFSHPEDFPHGTQSGDAPAPGFGLSGRDGKGGGEVEKEDVPPHAGPTTVPERMDILLGTRFDAPFLGCYNKMLDYHPGNVRYDSLLETFANLPSSLIGDGAAVGVAVSSVLEQVTVPVLAVTPRFLYQNPSDGTWSVVPESGAKKEIRRALQRKRSNIVEGVGRHLKTVRADGRFGGRRGTVMARRFVPKFVSSWEGVLYGESQAKEGAKGLPAPLPSSAGGGRSARSRPQPASVLPPLPATSDMLDTAEPGRASSAVRRYVRRDAHLRRGHDPLRPGRAIGAGDRVLVAWDDGGGRWEGATVVKVYPDATCLVTDGEGHYGRFKARKQLRRYVPLVEGEEVEVAYGDRWYAGVIGGAHPVGRYTVEFEGEEKDEDVKDFNIRRLKDGEYVAGLRLGQNVEGNIVEGEFVRVYDGRRNQWFYGQVQRVWSDGTYDVDYKNGGKDRRIPGDFVRPQ